MGEIECIYQLIINLYQDEFDEWLRVNDPTWKPAHTEIKDRLPMIR